MRRRLVVAVLLAVMLAVSLGGMALAASQTWDLDSDSVMYKEPHTESLTVDIAKGTSHIWRAEDAAQVDVSFSAGTWTGNLTNQTTHSNKRFTVSVGTWNGTTFTGYGTSSTYDFGSSTTVAYSLTASAFTVLTGDWLAIEVASVGNVSFTLVTDGTCDVISPTTDPAYPIPEFPTIILLATGLVCLALFSRLLGFSFRGASSSKVGNP